MQPKRFVTVTIWIVVIGMILSFGIAGLSLLFR